MHVEKKTSLFHSSVDHLEAEREKYAKNPGFHFKILEATTLNAAYSTREALFNLSNALWSLKIDTGPENRKWKSEVAESVPNSEVEKILEKLLASESSFGEYLNQYRHPDVHDEIVSKVSGEDVAQAISGKPRSHIEKFITDSVEIRDYIEEKEKTILEACREQIE